MPQPSIIIPIIVTGIIVGSIMTGKRIRKKRLLIASLVSGLLNAGYGYVLYLVAPPPTFTYRGGTGGAGFTGGTGAAARAASGGGELVFVISSFLAGFLIVLATIGIALVYARYRKKSDEEPEESPEPEESEKSAEPKESEALDL